MEEFSLETRIAVLMQKYNFHFKKSLGQNFLVSKEKLNSIVAAANLTEEDFVLEIGPGMGFLTEALAKEAGLVHAVEVDDYLYPLLCEVFQNTENIRIRHEDALTLDFPKVAEEGAAAGFLKPMKIVANLPYYITTPLLFYFLEHASYWSEMVIMVQKEVAERIAAPAGKKDYGVLTLMVQYDATAEIVTDVPRTCFRPAPNVDSAVLRLTKRDTPPAEVLNKDTFRLLVKAGFGQRRKTLSNALTNGGLQKTKEEILVMLQDCGIDGKRRGETLTFEEYAALSNYDTRTSLQK